MVPVRFPLTVYENATLELNLLFDDGAEEPTPIDLTGYTARMQVRPEVGAPDSELIVTLSTENGGIVIDGEAGMVTIFIQDVDLESGKYDVLLFAPSGKRYKPIKTSPFKVVPGITSDE